MGTNDGDIFLFFYAGHGTSVTDTDGDEEDHKDEAYVCVTSTGQLDLQNSLLTDDEFSSAVCSALPHGAFMLNVSDCCHSGSICDFKRPCWNGRKAISIAGCRDTQTSGDTGNGGICTHAMLLAIESLQKKGKDNYTVQQFFNEVLSQDDATFASPQDITIDSTKSAKPSQMPWPLIPKSPFTAPYHSGGGGTAPVGQPAATIATAGSSIAAPTAQYVTAAQPQAQYVSAGAQYVSAQPQYTTATGGYPYVAAGQGQYVTAGAPQYMTAAPQYVQAQPQY